MTAFPPTPDASPKVKNTSLVPSSPSSASTTSTTSTATLCADGAPSSVTTDDGVSAAALIAPAHRSTPTTPESIAKSPKCCSTYESTPLPALSPMRSRQGSDTPSACASLGSLPPLLQFNTFNFVLQGDCGEIAPDLIECADPRFVNHNFCALLERRRALSRIYRTNRLTHMYFQPLLVSPAVVTSMQQLNALSGLSYLEMDRKKKGKQPLSHNGDFNEFDSQTNIRTQAKRQKVRHGSGQRVRDLVLIIAGLPGGLLEYNSSVRFPPWYIDDFMRYDLEALGVEKLTVLVPTKSSAASILNATVPNHETIKHLHIEVSTTEPFFAPEQRFYSHYTHDPGREHICPRLSLHADNLETLIIRNTHICRHLFEDDGSWRKLRNLNVMFHNGNRGLCSSDGGGVVDPEVEVNESYKRFWSFCTQRPCLLVDIAAWYDIWTVVHGDTDFTWRTVHDSLLRRAAPGAMVISAPYEWWKALIDGTVCPVTPGPSPSVGTRIVNDSEEVEDGSDPESDTFILLDPQFSEMEEFADSDEVLVQDSTGQQRQRTCSAEDVAIFNAATKPRQMKIL